MQLLKYSTFAIILALLGVAACTPPDDFPVGTTGDYYTREAITGDWKLQSVLQTDDNAPSSFPDSVYALKSLDLVQIFPGYSKITARFEGTADSSGMASFSISNPDSVPMYIPQSGKWAYDKASSPVRLKLRGPLFSSADSTVNGVFKPAYRATDNKLTIVVSRTQAGKNMVSYRYNFIR